MNENWIKGTGVALVTPFKKDKSIDFNALENIVEHVITQGVNYLVALGTTGETPTLSKAEKKAILECVLSKNNHRLPVVCGIGGNDTQSVLADFSYYPLDNVAAILSVAPYYNKPTQAGIIAHFKEIDQHTPKPIILYNVPGRTGVNMLAETSLRLAKEGKHTIAIKEASGNLAQCMQLVKNKPPHFAVLSGDDDLALAQMAIGFDGIISVAANCFTKPFCHMVELAMNSQMDEARRLHYQLLDGIDLLFTEGNPAGVKAVLSEMGLCEHEFRLPVVPVSDPTMDAIRTFMQRYRTII